MRILWYFHVYTQGQQHPVTLWVEANNQLAARGIIMRENPYINRLIYLRSKRIE